MKYVWFVISIIPMPFFLNYIDIAKPNSYLPIITLLFYTLITGYLSIKINPIMMFIATMISTVISFIVAPIYLIPPNESWFNPFTMNISIIILGFFIVIAQLLVRSIVKFFVSYLKNRLDDNGESIDEQ